MAAFSATKGRAAFIVSEEHGSLPSILPQSSATDAL